MVKSIYKALVAVFVCVYCTIYKIFCVSYLTEKGYINNFVGLLLPTNILCEFYFRQIVLCEGKPKILQTKQFV
jgi:hypothetical protein